MTASSATSDRTAPDAGPSTNAASSSSTDERFRLSGPTIRLDARIHAYRDDLADIALAGQVLAPHYAKALIRACGAHAAYVRAAANEEAGIVSELLPGEEGWAQLLLSQPLAVVTGDRVIIRDANDTLGGGTIVATQARRHPRRRESVIAELERLAERDPAESLYAAIAALEDAVPDKAAA